MAAPGRLMPAAPPGEAGEIVLAWAVVPAGLDALPASYLPDNAWGFRQLGTVGRVVGDDGVVTDEGVTWTTARPSAGQPNTAIWSVERAVLGAPATGDEVAAEWEAPVRESVTNPRQWTPLYTAARRRTTTSWVEWVSDGWTEYDQLAFFSDGYPISTLTTSRVTAAGYNYVRISDGGDFGGSNLSVRNNNGALEIRAQDSSERAWLNEIWGVNLP
ncbi:MAG: hypothetical protein F4160_11900 [Rhodospirillaceae bacterium]|nr:hypothetical protein [Rhodospirillaceae bacterium]